MSTTTENLTLVKARKQLSELLDGLIKRTPGMNRAVLGSNDGIRLSFSTQPADKAETLAAITSAMYSLSQGHFKDRPGGTRQIVVEHDGGNLFLMSAGVSSVDGLSTLLAVDTTPDADPGLVGHEMAAFISGLDEHLVVQARNREFTKLNSVSG
jgi:predicted regulator of Ras-like GTPase activity (Roadblock/LC7/MglB family)